MLYTVSVVLQFFIFTWFLQRLRRVKMASLKDSTLKLSIPVDIDHFEIFLNHRHEQIQGRLLECYASEIASRILRLVEKNCNGCIIVFFLLRLVCLVRLTRIIVLVFFANMFYLCCSSQFVLLGLLCFD